MYPVLQAKVASAKRILKMELDKSGKEPYERLHLIEAYQALEQASIQLQYASMAGRDGR